MRRLLALLLAILALAACGGAAEPPESPESPQARPTPTPAPTPSPAQSPSGGFPGEPAKPPLGTVPPTWLGTRVLPLAPTGYGEVRPTPKSLRQRRFTLPDELPALPGTGFASRVADPAPDDVIARSTWQPGCPVDRDELAWLRLTFRGFDGDRHTGELLVASAVADDLVAVFRDLWAADFPLEATGISTPADLDAAPTGDGNTTEAFVCRAVTGGSAYSQHAYGTAIDLNSFQNPYEKGDVVLPELASSYLDRSWARPGMVTADGPVVRAFGAVGWGWGGAWSSLKDYQHFSLSGT